MHVGFIVTKTPAEESFQSFLKILHVYMEKNEVTIFLIGNGVFAAKIGMLHSPIKQMIDKVQIYASSDDLIARGIPEDMIIKGVNIFSDYEDLVSDMMENMDQILSF